QRHDGRGNLTEGAHFGTDGKPCLSANGIARFTQRHDERGNLVEVAYFGTDGKPCLHRDGNAGFTRRHDERGNPAEGAYFGAKGERLTPRVEIGRVIPDSQAHRLGLRAGDVLLRYDSQPVTDSASFITARQRAKPGEEPRELVVQRD